jgi:DNA-binding HxlR family transcriptional regulator
LASARCSTAAAGCPPSVLRDRLAELREAGILATDADGRYELSGHGRGLLAALEPLSRWADVWGAATRG